MVRFRRRRAADLRAHTPGTRELDHRPEGPKAFRRAVPLGLPGPALPLSELPRHPGGARTDSPGLSHRRLLRRRGAARHGAAHRMPCSRDRSQPRDGPSCSDRTSGRDQRRPGRHPGSIRRTDPVPRRHVHRCIPDRRLRLSERPRCRAGRDSQGAPTRRSSGRPGERSGIPGDAGRSGAGGDPG